MKKLTRRERRLISRERKRHVLRIKRLFAEDAYRRSLGLAPLIHGYCHRISVNPETGHPNLIFPN